MNSGRTELSAIGPKRKRALRNPSLPESEESTTARPQELAQLPEEKNERHSDAGKEEKCNSSESIGDVLSPPSKKRRKKTQLANKTGTKLLPSKPLNAYNLFFRDERSRIIALREEQQGSSVELDASDVVLQAGATLDSKAKLLSNNDSILGEERETTSSPHERGLPFFQTLAKHIGFKWKTLSESERARYKALAADDMRRYRAEMQKYHENLMEETRETAAARVANFLRMKGHEGTSGSPLESVCQRNEHEPNEYTSVLFSTSMREQLIDEQLKDGMRSVPKDYHKCDMFLHKEEQLTGTVSSGALLPPSGVERMDGSKPRNVGEKWQDPTTLTLKESTGCHDRMYRGRWQETANNSFHEREQINSRSLPFMKRRPQQTCVGDSNLLEQGDKRRVLTHREQDELVRDILRSYHGKLEVNRIDAQQAVYVPMITMPQPKTSESALSRATPHLYLKWNRYGEMGASNRHSIDHYGLQQPPQLQGMPRAYRSFETQFRESQPYRSDNSGSQEMRQHGDKFLRTRNEDQEVNSCFPPFEKPQMLWDLGTGHLEANRKLLDVSRLSYHHALHTEAAEARNQRFDNLPTVERSHEGHGYPIEEHLRLIVSNNSGTTLNNQDLAQGFSHVSATAAANAFASRLTSQPSDIYKADQKFERSPYQTSLFSEIEKYYHERNAKRNSLSSKDFKEERRAEIRIPDVRLQPNIFGRELTPEETDYLLSASASNSSYFLQNSSPLCNTAGGDDRDLASDLGNSFADSLRSIRGTAGTITNSNTLPMTTNRDPGRLPNSSAGASFGVPSENSNVQQHLHLAQLLHNRLQESLLWSSR